MDLARFDDATKHMIIFDVLTDESPVGWKGERNRLYLSDVGYQKALDNQKAGNIKIISHAAVAKGNLYYDHRDMLNQASDDRSILAQRLNISPHQLSYVTNSGEGEGLLFYGNVILPFIDRFPTDLELYRIMTTKLNEVAQEKEA